MNLGDKYLKVWLTFNKSPTEDAKLNAWTTYGNPTIGPANAISGNALQLDGSSYIKLSNIELGGQDFEIDGWAYVDPTSPNNARLIHIVNPATGYAMLSVRKSATDNTKLDFWANSTADVTTDDGYTYTSDTVSIGFRIHFKLLYYRSDNHYIKLCINDKTVATWAYHFAKPNKYNRQKVDIYIGALPNGNQGIIGSVDEVTIYDGTWFTHNKGDVPVASYYEQLQLKADTKRNVKNPPLTWRYENPGNADLLTQAGTTITNLDETQSKTGTAFYQPTRAKCFVIPDTKEIWLKCDIYTTANFSGSNRIRIYNADSNGKVCGWSTGETATSNYLLWHNDTSITGSTVLGKNKNRSFLLHMVSDATNGVVEYFFSSGDSDKFTGDVNAGDDFANVYIQMDGSNILVSNLIISNSPLELTDDVAQLRQESVEFTADICGNVSKSLSFLGDTARKVEKTQEANFSLCRKIVKSAEITADTKRKINRSVKLLVGTLREVTSANLTPVEKYFDAVRNVINAIVASGDAERNVVKSLEVINDTERKIVQSIEVDFDAVRKIEKSTSISADTKRLTSNAVEVYFDAVRDVNKIWRLGYPFFSSASAYLDSAEIEVPATNEVWIKFNLLTNECLGSTRIGIMEDKDVWNLFGLTTKKETCRLWYGDFLSFDYGDFISLNHTLPKNANERFLIHMKSGVSDGLIEIFSGENLIGSYSGNVNDGDNFANFDYYGVKGTEGNVEARNFVISNAPLTVADNAHFDVEVSFSTLRKIIKQGPQEIYFDTCRRVANIWRIENYGTADLVDDNSEAETLEVGYSKSRTGYAYRYGNVSYYDIPVSEEVWIKLDVYFDSEVLIDDPKFKEIEVGAWVRTQRLSSQAVFVGEQPSYSLINVNLPPGKDFRRTEYRGAADFENPFEYNRLYRLLVHIKTDPSEGVIEYWLDNGKHLAYVGNVFNGEDIVRVYTNPLRFSNYSPLISNVIISNSPISIYEDVAEAGGKIGEIYSTVRKVLNPPLTWIYENYGTKDLILTEGRNYENLDFTQSRTGSAFTTLEKAKTFQINSAYEIWAKFDFYVENIGNYYDWDNPDVKGVAWGLSFLNLGLDPEEYNYEIASGIKIYSSGSSNSYTMLLLTDNGSLVEVDGDSKVVNNLLTELNDLNNCLLYMKSGTADGVIKLWINGNLKLWHVGNVNNGNIFNNISLYSIYDFKEVPATDYTVAYSQAATLFSNVKISNSELDISRNIELLSDTERNITLSKEIFFDTELNITYAGVWRYENYGTADLLAVEGDTDVLTQSAAIYQCGFISTASRQNYFNIPATNEVWIKFDFWFTATKETLLVGSRDDEKTSQVRLICTGVSKDDARNIFALSENVQSDTTNQFNSRQRYSAVVHLKADTTNGKIELFCSDGNNLTYTGNVNNGNDFENIYIQASHYSNATTYPYASNVIISNSAVEITENAKMPLLVRYDLQRNLPQEILTQLATVRNVTKSQIIYADLIRETSYFVELFNDTCRDLKTPVRVNCDTARTIPHKLRIMPIPVADFSANQNNTDSNVQTLRFKKISLLADNPSIVINPSTDEITDGTQSIEINLNVQQLTDQITYTGVNPAAIMEEVQGQYLDHKFDVRIEKINKRGALYSWKCCTDIDEILYRQLDYQIPEDEQWHKGGEILVDSEQGIYESVAPMCMAGEHITHIAENMGKQPMLFFADFVSTVDVNAGGVTYHDLISSIFGWSSRVPNMLINVFLRGDKMFVVQRGHEPNTIDLTGTKHTVPNIDCELVRTAWGASVWSETETRSRKKFVGDLDFAPDPPPSGSGKEKDTEEHDDYSFDQEGLVTRSEVREGNTRTVTTYEYVTVGNRKYLSREEARIYEGDELVDTKITKHTYLGQGQMHSTSNDEEGSYLGGSVGASKGNDRRTPYDEYNYKLGGYTYDKDGNKKYIKSYKFGTERYEESRKVYGLSLFDTSFPVYEEEKLIEITNDINWLNRRTKETISMSIYDYPHLIDFTDKIVFEGNDYFLESNTATTTPRIINRQDVTFVRWY